MEKLNRQGVRNLDGKQSNERRRSAEEGCLHRWEHDRNCPCTEDYYVENRPSCRWVCAKCGALRNW